MYVVLSSQLVAAQDHTGASIYICDQVGGSDPKTEGDLGSGPWLSSVFGDNELIRMLDQLLVTPNSCRVAEWRLVERSDVRRALSWKTRASPPLEIVSSESPSQHV